MSVKQILMAATAATVLATSAVFAEGTGLMAKDAYARAATPNAKAGGVFMMLMNRSDQDDTLIEVRSDVAKRIELHTHIDNGDGIMKMTQIEGGIAVPAGGMHMLERGGDHVMLMGLTRSLVQGETVNLTLVFEEAGEVKIEVPVDNARKGAQSAHSN